MRKWNGMATEGDYAVSAEKIAFHRKATKNLRKVATEILGLTKDQFTVRVCAGGPAVGGESILHADNIYAQVILEGALSTSIPSEVMWRSCRGQKDYHGGTNRWGTWADFVAHCQKIAETGIYPRG